MSKYFWRVFWGMYLVLLVAYGLRIAWELIKPVLVPLGVLILICGVIWFVIDWWRNRWW